MKKALLILLSVILIGTSYAKEVSFEKAKTIALKAYLLRVNNYLAPTEINQLKISGQFTVKDNGETMYYVFNFDNYGFIIISAEDAMVPVLGYSFDKPYDPDHLSDNFLAWMGTYVDNIKYLRENNLEADAFVKAKNQEIENINPNAIEKTKTIVVDALIPSKWDQTPPNNYYCPLDNAGPGGRALTGCVATCMSQIMYYWRWPETGTGSHCYYASGYGQLCANFGNTEYQWNGMLDNLSISAPSSPAAQLVSHAGISVDMGYGPESSGAYSQDVYYAFKSYFKYSNSCQLLYRQSYTYTVWKGFVQDELDDKCPMYYAGQSSSGGHAFVLDGYTDDDEFHFNFGWGGYQDGWYPMYNPNGFSGNQQMVRNIFPSGSYTYPVVWNGTKNVPHLRGIIEDGSGPKHDYPTNTTHSWLIDPSLGNQEVTSITINFLDIDVAINDLITVYDGENDSAPVLGTFNGTTPPTESITSTQGKMFIKFVSDENGTGAGFRIHYYATQPSTCGTGVIFETQSATIDDGSGLFNYQNGKNCSWFIQPTGASSITIKFNEFDTQEQFDHVTIYDGYTYAVLDDFSGSLSNLPDSVVYNLGKLLMTFKTDILDSGEGWELYYYTDLVGVNDQPNIIDDLNIYPNPATNELNIAFNSLQNQEINIQLYDVKGTPVYQETMQNFIGNYTNNIDLSNFSKGVYFIRIVNNQETYTDKIVIE
jgi:hypothetical protein